MEIVKCCHNCRHGNFILNDLAISIYGECSFKANNKQKIELDNVCQFYE